jgi:hypothetical protein
MGVWLASRGQGAFQRSLQVVTRALPAIDV